MQMGRLNGQRSCDCPLLKLAIAPWRYGEHASMAKGAIDREVDIGTASTAPRSTSDAVREHVIMCVRDHRGRSRISRLAFTQAPT
jgi:hypothetical protein